MNSLDDTIVALSTPPGEGAIGIIRLSGKDAFLIADHIFKAKKRNVPPSSFDSHRLYLGTIVRGNQILDEGMASSMQGPKSFTGENTFEIYAHGSPFLLKEILNLILSQGARLAEPGEFTKRAFLNARLDLSQAEAVIDLIQAKSEHELKYALRQLQGEYSQELSKMRDAIFNIVVEAEANIDFPEYVPQEVEAKAFSKMLVQTLARLEELLKGAKGQRILKEGFKIVLMGEPNVGKSSLLNTLAQKELAIVTELPGTTRDAIEYEIRINGVPVHLIDTAGLRKPENIVEEKGIAITHKKFQEADLILWIFDFSQTHLDFSLIQPFLDNGKEAMMIVNKADLPQKINLQKISELFPNHPAFKTSALQGLGLNEFMRALEKWVLDHSDFLESQYMVNARHQEILKRCETALKSAQRALEEALGDDLIASDLRSAVQALDEILGRSIHEEMVAAIFSRFCIGK